MHPLKSMFGLQQSTVATAFCAQLVPLCMQVVIPETLILKLSKWISKPASHEPYRCMGRVGASNFPRLIELSTSSQSTYRGKHKGNKELNTPKLFTSGQSRAQAVLTQVAAKSYSFLFFCFRKIPNCQLYNRIIGDKQKNKLSVRLSSDSYSSGVFLVCALYIYIWFACSCQLYSSYSCCALRSSIKQPMFFRKDTAT